MEHLVVSPYVSLFSVFPQGPAGHSTHKTAPANQEDVIRSRLMWKAPVALSVLTPMHDSYVMTTWKNYPHVCAGTYAILSA